jgi:hypothetical protein
MQQSISYPTLFLMLLSLISVFGIGFKYVSSNITRGVFTRDAQHCSKSTGWTYANGVAVDTSHDVNITQYISSNNCGPGFLKFKVRGSVINGSGPILGVSSGSSSLLQQEYRSLRNLSLRINDSNQVSIIYLNDFYASDARIASFYNVRFSNPKCHLPDVNVVQPNIGNWNSKAAVGALVSKNPTTMYVCGSGELTMDMVGQRAQGYDPLVSITRDGKVVFFRGIGGQVKIRLTSVSEGIFTLRLVNPYSKELANRDLVISDLTFVVDSQTR